MLYSKLENDDDFKKIANLSVLTKITNKIEKNFRFAFSLFVIIASAYFYNFVNFLLF